MHVDDIMKNYNPMYPTDGTWQDTFRVMRECPTDLSIVEELISDLEKYGEFREPIVLSTLEEYMENWADYKFDEGEELDPYYPQVMNGTHRVFAHYLAQQKEAKIQLGWYPDGKKQDDDNDDMYPMLASRISFPVKLDDDSHDEMFIRCRSFKLTEEIWINSDMMSSYDGTFQFYWDSGLEEAAAEDLTSYIELLDAKVTALVEEIGGVPIIQTMVLKSEADDDAFFYPERSNA